jgi:pullulanase
MRIIKDIEIQNCGMFKTIMLSARITPLMIQAQLKQFGSYPVYEGADLGLTYSKQSSSFRIWSPPAEKAQLLLYKEGLHGSAFQTIDMKKSSNGTWATTINKDIKGTFYTFRVMIHNVWLNDVPDPYVVAVGVNGKRAVVIDLDDTDPAGWEKDHAPQLLNNTVAIIY